MSKASDDLLQVRIDELRLKLRNIDDPKNIAQCCGMEYRDLLDIPSFFFSVFNNPVEIQYPELILRDVQKGESLNIAYQAMVCYYMLTSVSNPVSNSGQSNWVSFADLSDGRFYNKAFQGYTGDKLAPKIAVDISKLSKIAKYYEGSSLELGDLAFQFSALPKVPIAIVYWLGDEDFPSSCKILFKSTVSYHLPTDACAILGSMLTQMILKQFK
jgi:hypothetical protein